VLEIARSCTIRRFWHDPQAAHVKEMGKSINSIKEEGLRSADALAFRELSTAR